MYSLVELSPFDAGTSFATPLPALVRLYRVLHTLSRSALLLPSELVMSLVACSPQRPPPLVDLLLGGLPTTASPVLLPSEGVLSSFALLPSASSSLPKGSLLPTTSVPDYPLCTLLVEASKLVCTPLYYCPLADQVLVV